MFQPDRVLLLRQIAELGPYIQGLTLDVGAGGYSRYSRFLGSKRGIRLDVSIKNKPDLVGDAQALPFKDETFDSVVCTQVLGQLGEPDTATGEFYRVLKPRGTILLTDNQTAAQQDDPVDYWRFTRSGLERLCRSRGFTIIAFRQRGGFFTMLGQVIIRHLINRFQLYRHPVIGRLCNWPFKLMGGILMALDRVDQSQANRKDTIGWLVVGKK